MSTIQFEVIDLNCQAADSSFFIPQVHMTTQATSTFATLHGYSEFIASSPPKKYKVITFTGFSRRVGFTAEQVPQQCAGAKYVYSGVGSVNSQGNQVTNYTKNFFAQCSKAFWPNQPIQLNPNAISAESGVFPRLVGYCWPSDPASCPTCDPNEANWSFLGNQAVNSPGLDLIAFLGGPATITATTWSINETFSFLTSINQNPNYTFSTSGFHYPVTVGAAVYDAQSVFTDPTPLTFPVVAIKATDNNIYAAEYMVVSDTNNYSAVLSVEYTDAEAVANAQVITSTGATAQNMPRTTGFTSVTTGVVYTLNLLNLVNGQPYTVTVDLWEQATGISNHVTKTYNFTASGTTNTIVDIVPTPLAGRKITVQKPTIARG